MKMMRSVASLQKSVTYLSDMQMPLVSLLLAHGMAGSEAEMPMLLQVEAYYFSSAAGHKRILGNRRFGENGFISSGRMQARPVAQSSRSGSKVGICLIL